MRYIQSLIRQSAESGDQVAEGRYTDERAEALQHETDDYEDDGEEFTARGTMAYGQFRGEPWTVVLRREE